MLQDFQLDTILDAPAKSLVEQENGDLVIEGYAANYEIDRAGEFFVPGVFKKAIDTYLARGAPLLYHHKLDRQLGQVIEAEEREHGMWVKAIVPKPVEDWAVDVYNRVRRGMTKGLSVRGNWTPIPTARGGRIGDADIIEVSITPTPVQAGALFSLAGKALADYEPTDEEKQAVRDYLDEQFTNTRARLAEIAAQAS